MSGPADRSRTRGLAMAAAALMLLVVVASAYLRAVQHSIPAEGPAIAAARIAHRFAALGVGLALLAITSAIAARRPRNRRMLGYALAALVLVGILALVGARSAEGGVPAPATAFVNVTGGLALVAIIWRLGLGSRCDALRAPVPSAWAARAALVAAAFWVVGDAAVATGIAAGSPGAALGAGAWSLPALVALAVTGGVTALALAAAQGAPRTLGALVAILIAAAVTIDVLSGPGQPVALGVMRALVAALLLCALVSAAAVPRTRQGASTPR